MDRKGAYAIGAHVAENHWLARSHFFKATCERLSSVSLSQLFGRVTGRIACGREAGKSRASIQKLDAAAGFKEQTKMPTSQRGAGSDRAWVVCAPRPGD